MCARGLIAADFVIAEEAVVGVATLVVGKTWAVLIAIADRLLICRSIVRAPTLVVLHDGECETCAIALAVAL